MLASPITAKDTLQTAKRASPGNRLLAALPRNDRLRFIDGCEDVANTLERILLKNG